VRIRDIDIDNDNYRHADMSMRSGEKFNLPGKSLSVCVSN